MATKRHKELRTIRLLRILSPLWLRILYQYLPKSSQPAKIFLTTDGHGLTRMKSDFLLSVSIRVHPWLDHLGCGFAALRRIATLQAAGRGIGLRRRRFPTAGRVQLCDAEYNSALRWDVRQKPGMVSARRLAYDQ